MAKTLETIEVNPKNLEFILLQRVGSVIESITWSVIQRFIADTTNAANP